VSLSSVVASALGQHGGDDGGGGMKEDEPTSTVDGRCWIQTPLPRSLFMLDLNTCEHD